MTPTRLYPLYCTLYLCTLTLTHRHLQALVNVFRSNSKVCTSLATTFRLRFCLEIYKLFFLVFFLLDVDRSYHSTHFLNTFTSLIVFLFALFWAAFDPEQTYNPAHILHIRFLFLTLSVSFIFACPFRTYRTFFCFNPWWLSHFCTFVFSTVATTFYSSWDKCPSNLWTLHALSEISTKTHDDLTHPVAAAATTQVKLCPYDKEEPHIWFSLIEAQFTVAGIRSQKL